MYNNKVFTSEEIEKMIYPLKFPCTSCGKETIREKGDDYYKFSYRCVNKKCCGNTNNLYGPMFTPSLSYENKDGTLYEIGINATGEEKIYYKITYIDGNFILDYLFKFINDKKIIIYQKKTKKTN
jgi:tRNA G26 N,N-dimethylase Trm1